MCRENFGTNGCRFGLEELIAFLATGRCLLFEVRGITADQKSFARLPVDTWHVEPQA